MGLVQPPKDHQHRQSSSTRGRPRTYEERRAPLHEREHQPVKVSRKQGAAIHARPQVLAPCLHRNEHEHSKQGGKQDLQSAVGGKQPDGIEPMTRRCSRYGPMTWKNWLLGRDRLCREPAYVTSYVGIRLHAGFSTAHWSNGPAGFSASRRFALRFSRRALRARRQNRLARSGLRDQAGAPACLHRHDLASSETPRGWRRPIQ